MKLTEPAIEEFLTSFRGLDVICQEWTIRLLLEAASLEGMQKIYADLQTRALMDRLSGKHTG